MAEFHADLVTAIRQSLADAGDAERARAMRHYLKSELPCRGVGLPDVRRIVRTLSTTHPIKERRVWVWSVRALYDDAEYREERYAAIALTGQRPFKEWQTPTAVPLYQHMIIAGAWWDLVDEIAIKRVGPVSRSHPALLHPVLLDWAEHDDIWLRRSAIISQVGAKDATDQELLAATIAPSINSKEFFLRKGIGWALREYAKANPEWVRAFVSTHEGDLSPLSRREATKHIAMHTE